MTVSLCFKVIIHSTLELIAFLTISLMSTLIYLFSFNPILCHNNSLIKKLFTLMTQIIKKGTIVDLETNHIIKTKHILIHNKGQILDKRIIDKLTTIIKAAKSIEIVQNHEKIRIKAINLRIEKMMIDVSKFLIKNNSEYFM